ncbi:oxidation resistance protein 1-like protein, partial [Tanacetum coccineum]
AALYAALPVLSQGKKWALLCSTWRHSISLSTLYRRSSLCSRLSLLVVGDTKGVAFGGLVEAPLRPSTKKRYQGSNNTFVLTNASGPPVIFCPTGVICMDSVFVLSNLRCLKRFKRQSSITQDQEESETLGSKIHGLEQNVKDVDTKLRQNEATIKELRKLQDQ